MHGSRNFAKGHNDRRVHFLVEVGHSGIVAIYRQQVLGEVIGPHRHEVGFLGQQPRLIHRRGHFDEHAYLRPLNLHALFDDLGIRLIDQPLGATKLCKTRNHRQHDAQIAAQTFVGL